MFKTKVLFLINETDKENPDLFAFFPKEISHKIGKDIFYEAYSHIGQHSSCHLDYALESRFATEDEYKDLKTELESYPYEYQFENYNAKYPYRKGLTMEFIEVIQYSKDDLLEQYK